MSRFRQLFLLLQRTVEIYLGKLCSNLFTFKFQQRLVRSCEAYSPPPDDLAECSLICRNTSIGMYLVELKPNNVFDFGCRRIRVACLHHTLLASFQEVSCWLWRPHLMSYKSSLLTRNVTAYQAVGQVASVKSMIV